MQATRAFSYLKRLHVTQCRKVAPLMHNPQDDGRAIGSLCPPVKD